MCIGRGHSALTDAGRSNRVRHRCPPRHRFAMSHPRPSCTTTAGLGGNVGSACGAIHQILHRYLLPCCVDREPTRPLDDEIHLGQHRLGEALHEVGTQTCLGDDLVDASPPTGQRLNVTRVMVLAACLTEVRCRPRRGRSKVPSTGSRYSTPRLSARTKCDPSSDSRSNRRSRIVCQPQRCND